MAGRLTLSTIGIKSPLDVAQAGQQPAAVPPQAAEPTPRVPAKPPAGQTRERPRRARKPHARPAPDLHPVGDAPFYAAGRPLQTSIALDAAGATQLEELARAARVSFNALAVAVLHAGLPLEADAVRSAIVDERVRRAGDQVARVERNLRLPEQLRARVDALTAAARDRLPRATRADLVNAALRRSLPADAQAAAELVAEHAKRLERAAAG
jgi:hypothetical protein